MTTRMPEGMPYGDLGYDDNPGDTIPKNVSPLIELGVTGVKRVSGYIDEEFLPALRGRKAIKVYREMSTNDSMVGALLFTIDKLAREVEWKVIPADQTPENIEAQEFLEGVMDDMSHSWDDFIGEVLSMLVYGWSWHEMVFKKRLGPWEKDPRKRSRFSDGKIGIRKMPIRSQETMLRWSFDDTGGVRALVQMAPPIYKTTVIPIEKSLLFRTSISKGNPEGVSLLRTAYRSWYFKKRLEEFEAIGVERDLAGMPVARVPSEFLKAQHGTEQHKTVEAFKKMVRGVRRDENEGLVLPSQFDRDTKQQMFEFELLSAGGSRTFDTNSIIQRYEQRILMSVLADFILVGHQATGSYSLHTDKTGIFRAALNAIIKAIADTLNRHMVPKLFAANAWKLDELPRFEPTNVDPPDISQLAQFISSTAGAGMQWFPDPELEKFVREIARLPEMTDETVDFKRQMLMQEQAMQYADSQMGLLGMQQRAEMTAEGYSPEQAEQQMQMMTPEQQQYQAQGEMDAEQLRREHPVGQMDREQEMQQQEMAMGMEQQKLAAQNAPPPEDPNAEKNHLREKEKMDLQERGAQAAQGREKEKMTLQEKIEQQKHKRTMEQMKMKEREAKLKPKLPPSGRNKK